MESGLLHDFLGNFSMQDEIYYFHGGEHGDEIEPMRGEIEMNIRKLIIRIVMSATFSFELDEISI